MEETEKEPRCGSRGEGAFLKLLIEELAKCGSDWLHDSWDQHSTTAGTAHASMEGISEMGDTCSSGFGFNEN